MAPKQPKPDQFDALAQGDPKKVIALMLWKARHRQPDMYVQIDQRDIDGYNASITYLKVKPEVMIKHPQGLPEQPASPAVGNRRAVPARGATPAKPYLVVALVEAGTENAIRPIEDNQEDFDTAKDSAAMRKARDQAPDIARRILSQAQSGNYSLSDVQDAADALMTLSRAMT